jgi:hypothetical protein
VNDRGIHCGIAALLGACSFDSTGGTGEGSSASATDVDTTAAADDDGTGTTSTASASESDSGTSTGADATSSGAVTTDDGGSSGPPDPCAVDNGGCDEDATCSIDDDGEIECECPDGFDDDGEECTVVPALEVLRWELPCTDDLGATCTAATTASDSAVLVGETGVLYDVELRVRGVLEQKAYVGGVDDGLWYQGGDPLPDAGWNSTELAISDPAQIYRYNNGPSSVWECVEVDITRSVKVLAGATITISVANDNGIIITNDTEIVVPDVDPAPGAFDGQFAQLEAVSITH